MNIDLPEFTVRAGIWDDTVKIAEVQRWRHTVIFPEDCQESKVTFCNNCGSPFSFGDQCAACGLETKP